MANNTLDNGSGLAIAFDGWRRESWLDGYYPEDLPEDWQLGFYANDCSAVVVSLRELLAEDIDDLSDAVNDLLDSFVFYLDARESVSDLSALPAVLECLDGKIKGVIGAGVEIEGYDAWSLDEGGQYVDGLNNVRLSRVSMSLPLNLRQLKETLLALPKTCEVVVFSGDNLNPSCLGEVRPLIDILGLA